MLHANLYVAILGYAGTILIFIIAIWMWIELNAHSGSLGGQGVAQRKWRCHYCGYMYLGSGEEQLSQCPRCESFNTMSEK
ncbi:MAG: hypothetical protein C4520_16405 [Candidatus Abyssobacteria bacterium SURF_5]|uniref:Hydrogenase nickel incorporation protein HypA n=1 Tax=Abyssobacteria bacterium (strain SURF_5) TaxID=2093360 RepID=A0A3A4NFU7_ABYX5|nr:MAG: hypothetical protein C4520_16405 [Candidatus Abyssubacteria bacterium SURF_5]